MRCLQLMVGMVLGFGAVASAGDRDAARDVEPIKGAVSIQGLEQLPADVQVKLIEAIRELGPGVLDRTQRQKGLTLRESGDLLTFRIDTREGIHLIQMVRENGKLVTKFAAVRSWPDVNGTVGLRIQMVDGEVQVNQAREQWGLQSSQGEEAGGVADASGSGCTTTTAGVCCSFTNGNQIRIVCMCRTAQSRYELCGDTGWLM